MRYLFSRVNIDAPNLSFADLVMYRLLGFIVFFEDPKNDMGRLIILSCRASMKMGDNVGSPPPSLLNCEHNLEAMTIVIEPLPRAQRLCYTDHSKIWIAHS